MTYGTLTLFWQPLILVVVNCLGWRYLHTKKLCWQEVFVVGIGVRLVRIAIDHVTWDAYTRHFKARAYVGYGRR